MEHQNNNNNNNTKQVKQIFNSLNDEKYKDLFNKRELIDSEAIEKSHDTDIGLNEIRFQMLKNFPKISHEMILHIVNIIWTPGIYLESWC